MNQTTATRSGQTVSAQNIGDSQSPSEVTANIQAATPSSIKSILLPDGWHNVSGCQLIQFALGEARSPINPTKFYPYLTYTEDGREVFTPMGQVISLSLSSSQS